MPCRSLLSHLLACFVIGAGLHFGVAQAIGWWGIDRTSPPSLVYAQLDSTAVELYLQQGYGWTLCNWRAQHESFARTSRRATTQVAEGVPLALADAVPSWCAAHDLSAVTRQVAILEASRRRSFQKSPAVDIALGWPLRSFVGHREAALVDNDPQRFWPAVMLGGIVRDPSLLPVGARYRALAWGPIWPGLVAGTFFWAVASISRST